MNFQEWLACELPLTKASWLPVSTTEFLISTGVHSAVPAVVCLNLIHFRLCVTNGTGSYRCHDLCLTLTVVFHIAYLLKPFWLNQYLPFVYSSSSSRPWRVGFLTRIYKRLTKTKTVWASINYSFASRPFVITAVVLLFVGSSLDSIWMMKIFGIHSKWHIGHAAITRNVINSYINRQLNLKDEICIT